MRTAEWLTDPTLRSLLLPGLIAGVAVVVAGSVLSVLVVLKRLSFVGQGVSHSAFGGIGVAAAAGVLGSQASGGWAWSLVIVLGFCVLAAIGMALLGDRQAVREDTAIGIFLVASMSLGAALLSVSIRRGAAPAGYEGILFGQLLSIGPADAAVAALASAAVLGALWWIRRPMTLWAFDPTASEALGVRGGAMRLGLMVLLAIAIVTAMKLVGVVLATAILVLPGAAALRLRARLATICLLSVAFGLLGLLVGLVASLELDLPPGATIVLAMTALFTLISSGAAIRRRTGTARA